MTSQAAFYILISSAVLAFTEQSTCQNSVFCPCGSTGKKIMVCVNETNIEDPCSKWASCTGCQYLFSQCLQCTNSSEDSLCIKGTMQKKSRQKRQYRSQGVCPQLQPPKPGSMSCTSYSRQRTCTGMCGPGYNFENWESSNEIQLTCRNGVWTPQRSFPVCKSNGQCDLNAVGSAGFNCESDSAGTYCDVRCSYRYEGRFYCYPGRGWNPSLPHCVEPKDSQINSEIHQTCPCQNGGQCDTYGQCVCPADRTGKFCESSVKKKTKYNSFTPAVANGHCNLKVIGFGRFNCTSNSYGTTCDIYCYSRYAGRFYCYPGRGWNPSLPRCIAPKDSEAPLEYRQPCRCQYGGQCNGNSQCICPGGYTGRYCETRVTDPPVILCPDPGHVAEADRLNSDGSFSYDTQSYRIGQSVTYTCHSGFALQRNSIITCLASGRWSDSLPSCIPIEPVITTTAAPRGTMCPDPGQVANANRLNTDGTLSQGTWIHRIGMSLAFTCHYGFVLQGSSLITCYASGRWSDRLPVCISVQNRRPIFTSVTASSGIMCPDPGQVANAERLNADGSLSQSTQRFRVGQSLAFACYSGFVLQRSSLITCRASGRWSDRLPSCIPMRTATTTASSGIMCPDPGQVANAERLNTDGSLSQSTQRFRVGQSLAFACYSGFVLQQSSLITCRASGRWSDRLPSCIPMRTTTTTELSTNALCCVDPEYPASTSNKQVHHTFPQEYPRACPAPPDVAPQYPRGTRLEYTCEEGFDLKGLTELYCMAAGSWTADPPSCEMQCGKTFVSTTRRIIHGSKTYAGEWPWVVAIAVTGNSQIICGGAVLNRRVVVTAAHCLRQADSFTLYFGKFHLEDDDKEVESRTSTRVIIYPNYNSTTHDSDIGLVMFDPIAFTERVQPICLPEKKTTRKNLKPGTHGYVTGWGDTERARQADALLLASLPVIRNDECEKSLNLKLTQNMFCAGFKGGEQSTCTGDSGSPLVFFDAASGKYNLEGIVSFSVQGQCGQPEMYTVFTRVSLFTAWIQTHDIQ